MNEYPQFQWNVSFEYAGEWEWVAIEAEHPAAAKTTVDDELGEHIGEWGPVTPTDARQSIDEMLEIRKGRKLGSVLTDLVSR